MRFHLSVLLSGLVVAGLLGCASPQTDQILQFDIAHPQAVELDNVPLIRHEKYCSILGEIGPANCGSAA
jgi:hypothetical protein